jgi:hypothetical protein
MSTLTLIKAKTRSSRWAKVKMVNCLRVRETSSLKNRRKRLPNLGLQWNKKENPIKNLQRRRLTLHRLPMLRKTHLIRLKFKHSSRVSKTFSKRTSS